MRTCWTSSAQRLLLAVLAASGAGCSTGPSPPEDGITLHTSFDSGWDGWSGDSAAVQVHPDEPVPIAWSLRPGIPGLDGPCALLEHQNRSGRTRQWIEKPVEVPSGDVRVTLSFRAGLVGTRGLQRQALASLGTSRPRASADPATAFRELGPLGTLEDDPGATQAFELTETLRLRSGDLLWVAVGYRSGLEVQHAVCLDDIRILVEG